MKRINKQQMTEIVTTFLERRNYSDSNETTINRKPIKSKSMEFKSNQSLGELALKGSLVNSSSDSDVICLSQSNGDFSVLAENAFKQFIEFIEKFRTKQRLFEQLLQLEFPLFVHIFIEMFDCGHRLNGNSLYSVSRKTDPNSCDQLIARRFFRDHKNRFKEIAEQQIIDSMFISLNNLNLETSLKNFKSSKYSVKISDKCLEQLKKYLKDSNDLIVIQLLNFYFEFNLYSTHNQTESEKKLDSMNCKQTLKRSSHYNELDLMPSLDPSVNSLNSECKELKKAIENLRNTDPCVPPLNRYTINSTNVCSAVVSDDMSAIAFGFEDSKICLKKIGQNVGSKLQSNIEIKRNIKQIQLNAIEHDIDEDTNQSDTTPNQTPDIDQIQILDVMILRGHSGPVYDLTFIAKTNLLVSCSHDTTVRAWDTTNGNNVAIYNSHLGPVFSIDRSQIGQFFVTGGKDSVCYLWSIERSFPLRILCGHTDSINCVRFHPNCNFVATSSADKEIKIWDIHKAIAVRTLVGHEAPIYCMTFTTDGYYLASGGEDRKIKIWDLYSGQMAKELSGHTDAVYSLSFNHCNEVLASCSADQSLKIWNCSQVTNTSDKTHIPESDITQNQNRNRKELLKTFRLETVPIHNQFMPKDLLVLIAKKST